MLLQHFNEISEEVKVMKKFYTEPELEIRKYSLSGNGVMTLSNPEGNDNNDLNKDDSYDNIIG